jgi:hypothetical protein
LEKLLKNPGGSHGSSLIFKPIYSIPLKAMALKLREALMSRPSPIQSISMLR